MATHFDFEGNPNGWTSREFTVFGIPLFLLVCQWVAVAATLSDPKHKNLSEKVFRMILWIVPMASLLLSIVCYGYELGYKTSDRTIAFATMLSQGCRNVKRKYDFFGIFFSNGSKLTLNRRNCRETGREKAH